MTTMLQRLEALESIVAAHARVMETGSHAVGSFGAWLPLASPELTWSWPWTEYVTEHLDAVTAGEIDRLMVLAPVRHGKSELITVRYPVYRLVRDPTTPIIMAMHTSNLAKKFSRKVRRLARVHCRLSDERDTAAEWETIAGGGMRPWESTRAPRDREAGSFS